MKTKIFIAIIFFCVGFLTNHLLVKYKDNQTLAQHMDVDRFPVSPDDFDQDHMLATIGRMNQDDIKQHDDEKFVYYEIPTKDKQKLKVEVKGGMIHIAEDSKSEGGAITSESSSERMFSIDPALDGDRAEVLNEKDKIVIKIPKR